MKSYQTQYAEILENLIRFPHKQRPSRIGTTRSRFVEVIRIDLQKEFPLMEIKKIQFSNILHELLWFIHGNTCNKYLIDNRCNIWTDDSWRYYNEKYVSLGAPKISKDEFIENTKNSKSISIFDPTNSQHSQLYYHYGDLDRVYGKQWRNFNGKTDQLQNCINLLIKNPDDRRIIVTAHNSSDIEDNVVGLPSCHNMFQFYTIPLTRKERINLLTIDDLSISDIVDDSDENIEKYLDNAEIPKFYLNIWFNIRSNDFFLGNPYNIASYALLNHIIANIVNMIPNELVCTAIDCHLYEAHILAAEEWVNRYIKIIEENYIGETGVEESPNDVTFCQSKIKINRNLTSIDNIEADDFELINYNPQSYIKAPLLT
jgi:thymidylate synthase